MAAPPLVHDPAIVRANLKDAQDRANALRDDHAARGAQIQSHLDAMRGIRQELQSADREVEYWEWVIAGMEPREQ